MVAIQGIGCACGGQPFTMNEIYKSYPRVNENDYTFVPERQADVVVINMLANDFETRHDKGVGIPEIIDKAVELLKIVRETYPEAKIIFAPASAEKRLAQAVEELGGEEAGYYVIPTIPMNFDGKGGHPSVEGHTSAVTSLMATIAEVTGLYN